MQMTTKQVENDLRNEMKNLTHTQLRDFARGMGVMNDDIRKMSFEQLKDECVRLELHAFVH